MKSFLLAVGASLLLASSAAAQNSRISDLDEVTAPAASDELVIVDNSGTPATKKVSKLNLLKQTEAPVQIDGDDLQTTSTDGIVLKNSTAATVALPYQISPRIHLYGSLWDTDDAVSRTSEFAMESRGGFGTTVSGQMTWQSNIDGAGWNTITYITDGGTWVANGSLFAGSHQLGSTTNGSWYFASSGEIRSRDTGTLATAWVVQKGAVQTISTTRTWGSTFEMEFTSSKTYTNGSDVDGVTVTLPDDPTAGLYYSFGVTTQITSSDFSIAPNTGEELFDGASDCSTSLTAIDKGATLTVQSLSAGSGALWAVTKKTGTWTCTP